MTFTTRHFLVVALALCASPSFAQVCGQPAPGFVAYVARIEPTRVLFAWGTTRGPQTIGYDSASHGSAEVWLGDRVRATEHARNWVWVDGLDADRTYEYTICLEGRRVRQGHVRTYPVTASRLTFFVIGDYGNGSIGQRRLGAALARALEAAESSGSPARFVLTTGDNFYRDGLLWFLNKRSGAADQDWQEKFFAVYDAVIGAIPFLPSVGNHDRGETESEADLAQYYDNFLFPPGQRRPYYTFGYGGLAQFFSLNTASPSGSPADKDREFGPHSTQRGWLQQALDSSTALWNIPYFHHPPFSAGPDHADAESRERGRHLMTTFKGRVRVSFTGHEHNFQMSEASDLTAGIRYIVTGSGGQQDERPRVGFERAGIELVASGLHFLKVEIDGPTMRVTIIGNDGPIQPLDRQGRAVALPIISAR